MRERKMLLFSVKRWSYFTLNSDMFSRVLFTWHSLKDLKISTWIVFFYIYSICSITYIFSRKSYNMEQIFDDKLFHQNIFHWMFLSFGSCFIQERHNLVPRAISKTWYYKLADCQIRHLLQFQVIHRIYCKVCRNV